jgi:deoxyribonuclease-2
MDKDSGFWLIHSIPRFAQIPTKKYEYPSSGKNNGQTALCISFKTKDEGSDIVTQLKYMGINMYDFFTTKDVLSIVTNINELKESRPKLAGDKRSTPVDSVGGTAFTSFARSKKGASSGDLYETYVAPKLKHNMFVETWRRGAGNPLNSSCKTPFKVNNINAIKLNFSKDSKLSDSSDWPYIRDHSKWGMSDAEDNPFVCIGDINRMASQNNRGGGTVCVKNANLWQRFRDSIYELDPCPLK